MEFRFRQSPVQYYGRPRSTRVLHGCGYSRGVSVTGVTGVGAVLDSGTPRWTANPYPRLWVFHGFSW
jgi:hypothetical protein